MTIIQSTSCYFNYIINLGVVQHIIVTYIVMKWYKYILLLCRNGNICCKCLHRPTYTHNHNENPHTHTHTHTHTHHHKHGAPINKIGKFISVDCIPTCLVSSYMHLEGEVLGFPPPPKKCQGYKYKQILKNDRSS